MGAGTGKLHQETQGSLPDFYYLNREKKTIHYITKHYVQITNLPDGIEVFQDSALVYLSTCEFFIVGGVKPSQKFSKKVFCFEVLSNQVRKLASLPLPTRSGDLIFYQNSIYLISAITMHENSEYPCPILKYCLKDEIWDVCDVNDLHLNDKYSISNIIHSQATLYGSKVLICAGIKINSGIPTKKVFSVDLSKPVMRFEIESFKLPQKLKEIQCIVIKNQLIVCGEREGIKEFYLYDFTCELWEELGKVQKEIREKYPPFVIGEIVVFVDYPDVLVRDGIRIWTCEIGGKEKKEIIDEICDDSNSSESQSESSESILEPVKIVKKLEVFPAKNIELKPPKIPNKSKSENRYFSEFLSPLSITQLSHSRRAKKPISTKYSESDAPFLPSNIIKSQSSFSLDSSDSSSNSDSDISSSSHSSKSSSSP